MIFIFVELYCICNKKVIEYPHCLKRSEILRQILRPLGVITRALDSIANIEFKEIDLSRGQYLYLVRICEEPGIILERMANLLKVDKTTSARAIQKLEKKGLIERRSDSSNKKIKKIYPTAKGEELYPLLLREEHHSNEAALKGLNEAEQDQLLSLLNRVADNIDDDWNYVKSGNKREY